VEPQPAAATPASRAVDASTASRAATRRHRAASIAGPVDTLAAERVMLDGARAALVHRDATGALSALRNHEQSFARGQLVEERERMKVQALALAHDGAGGRPASEKFP